MSENISVSDTAGIRSNNNNAKIDNNGTIIAVGDDAYAILSFGDDAQISNAGKIFTSQQLLQDVWDYPRDTGSPELVRAHVKNLREKLEPTPSKPMYIRTIKGHGYTFSLD